MDTQNTEAPDLTPWAEQLAGYVGYDSPRDRRSSDEAIRAALAVEVEDLLGHVESLQRHLASSEQTADLHAATSSRRDLLESLRNRVHTPPYKRALFFTMPALAEKAVNQIRENDRAVLLACEQIRLFLIPTLGTDTDFGLLLERLGSLIADLHDIIEERIEAIDPTIP